jgi:phage minor structural protein
VIPVLYPANETAFTTNGLGGLPDAISCVVTEQRNTPGGYWLEMEYPVGGLHYADIAPDRIIYAAPSMGNRPQPFRISRITRPINGIVHIEAPHVSSELQKIVTYGSFPVYTVYGGFDTFKEIATGLGQPVPFYMTSDIDLFTVQRIEFPHPASFSDVLLGAEGSFLDKIGGEFEWDGWHVILHKQRGVDTGLEIRYGVNMSDIEAETDTSNLVTAVIPYWKGTVNNQDTIVIGDMRISGNAGAYAYVRCVPLDVSSQFDLEQDQQPSKTDVTAKGQAFIDSTDLKELTMSINVKYTPLMENRNINLCDTVRVVHPDLGVSSTAKVVETRFNVLTGQYESITIGSIRKSIVDTIADIIKK